MIAALGALAVIAVLIYWLFFSCATGHHVEKTIAVDETETFYTMKCMYCERTRIYSHYDNIC